MKPFCYFVQSLLSLTYYSGTRMFKARFSDPGIASTFILIFQLPNTGLSKYSLLPARFIYSVSFSVERKMQQKFVRYRPYFFLLYIYLFIYLFSILGHEYNKLTEKILGSYPMDQSNQSIEWYGILSLGTGAFDAKILASMSTTERQRQVK